MIGWGWCPHHPDIRDTLAVSAHGVSYVTVRVERCGSRVEFPTLDYENAGSNPTPRCYNIGQVVSLYIAPVHSAV